MAKEENKQNKKKSALSGEKVVSRKKVVKKTEKKMVQKNVEKVTRAPSKASVIKEGVRPSHASAEQSEQPQVNLQASRKFWLYFLGSGFLILTLVQSYGYFTGWGDSKKVMQRHFNSAQRLTLAKRYQAAIKQYERIVAMKKVDPDTIRQAQVGIADLYRERKEWQKAIDTYRILQNQESSSVMAAWAGLKIAECQVESGQSEIALDTYTAIIKKYPNSDWEAEARLGQGQAQEKLKRYDEAIRSYRLLEKNYRGGFLAADALIHIGKCYERLANKSAARKTYESIIANYPETMADEAKKRLRRLDRGDAPEGISSWGE